LFDKSPSGFFRLSYPTWQLPSGFSLTSPPPYAYFCVLMDCHIGKGNLSFHLKTAVHLQQRKFFCTLTHCRCARSSSTTTLTGRVLIAHIIGVLCCAKSFFSFLLSFFPGNVQGHPNKPPVSRFLTVCSSRTNLFFGSDRSFPPFSSLFFPHVSTIEESHFQILQIKVFYGHRS